MIKVFESQMNVPRYVVGSAMFKCLWLTSVGYIIIYIFSSRTPTGVNTFIFQTTDGPRIHQAIHYWAEVITNKSTPTAATPDVSIIPPSRDMKLPVSL